MQPELSDVPM